MNVLKYVQSKYYRGFSIDSLGPNEARLLYDFAVGVAAMIFAFSYDWVFVGGSPSLFLWLLPVALVTVNAFFGIYGRLKTVSSRMKAAALVAAVIVVCGLGALLMSEHRIIILWGSLVLGPVVLARIFLGLPYAKGRNIASVVVKQRGPILLIGGAGYIGSHTVELLLNEGESVRVLDKLMYGRDSIADFMDNRNFELIEGDCTDIAKLTLAMSGASSVVHLAGLVGDPACAVDADFTRHTNIIATRMAKEVAQSMGIYRFVFASSCSVYGVTEHEVNEKDALNPVSLYAQTKIDSEKELLLSSRDDFFVTILRFATVFGHSRRPRFDLVANLFTAQAVTNGLITVFGPGQSRPFVHVRDVARSLVATLRADRRLIQSQIYNVGNGDLNMTILQLAEAVKRIAALQRNVDISITDTPGDQRNYRVSFGKIDSIIGFKPKFSMDEGITEMVGHFNAGRYGSYRDEKYNNVAIAQKASADFRDPLQAIHLYAPVTSERNP